MKILQALALFKDSIFPVYCLGCDSEGKWVCDVCAKNINSIGVFCCPICHKDTWLGSPCDLCKQSSPISRHVAVIKYDEDNIEGKLITAYKYSFAQDLVMEIESIVNKFFENLDMNIFDEVDLIVPVPLHARRYAERGFNQASVISRILSDQTGIENAELLKRGVYTIQQAKLSREKRLQNVKDAFFVINPDKIEDKTIAVVDDVYTTGSTIFECAKILKKFGAVEVVGFSLARG